MHRNILKSASSFFAMALIFLGHLSYGSVFNLSHRQMNEVLRIAKEIHTVQPSLDDSKYMEYAVGIYRAWQKYGIEPEVLIAITQRETSFREDLPEGKAGELGICQIRKMWVHQPKFRAEFKHASVRDLFRPSKSFLFAAWILRRLKHDVKSGSIPYWSYYNSVHFENRFNYFLAVNRNLTAIKKGEPGWVETAEIEPSLPMNQHAKRSLSEAPPVRAQSVALSNSAKWLRAEKKSFVLPKKSVRIAANPDGWIPAALRKLQEQQSDDQSYRGTRNHHISPAILRAAAELDVKSVFSSSALTD